ncbi:hypothetical protein C0Q70_08345 [Pomacea canaliculata]|uniref:Uncharacterized protein n=1 Tax=Pomacea canaliculata TaxID=400727 RepID=A0A2T7PHK2_POMCA|nr:uncharacterized protein LOC112562152 [Pomacea canaliculata]PVD32898.1 hypothetical protein C0Q70_08345 [Pomacea canaliculata]
MASAASNHTRHLHHHLHHNHGDAALIDSNRSTYGSSEPKDSSDVSSFDSHVYQGRRRSGSSAEDRECCQRPSTVATGVPVSLQPACITRRGGAAEASDPVEPSGQPRFSIADGGKGCQESRALELYLSAPKKTSVLDCVSCDNQNLDRTLCVLAERRTGSSGCVGGSGDAGIVENGCSNSNGALAGSGVRRGKRGRVREVQEVDTNRPLVKLGDVGSEPSASFPWSMTLMSSTSALPDPARRGSNISDMVVWSRRTRNTLCKNHAPPVTSSRDQRVSGSRHFHHHVTGPTVTSGRKGRNGSGTFAARSSSYTHKQRRQQQGAASTTATTSSVHHPRPHHHHYRSNGVSPAMPLRRSASSKRYMWAAAEQRVSGAHSPSLWTSSYHQQFIEQCSICAQHALLVAATQICSSGGGGGGGGVSGGGGNAGEVGLSCSSVHGTYCPLCQQRSCVVPKHSMVLFTQPQGTFITIPLSEKYNPVNGV